MKIAYPRVESITVQVVVKKITFTAAGQAGTPVPLRCDVAMADAFVLTQLASIKTTYDELGAQLEDPDIMSDTSELLRVMG